jgi:hypothetical protein
MTATLNEDATLLDGTGPFADLPEREPRFIWIPPKRGYLTRTVDEAIAWGWGQAKAPSQDWTGLCQSFCRQSYGVPAWAASAIIAWRKIPAKHKTSGGKPTDAPRGSLIYFEGGKYGHVALAIGKKTNRSCLSNDYVARGEIDRAPRDFPRWGIRYVGWSAWTPFGSMKLD